MANKTTSTVSMSGDFTYRNEPGCDHIGELWTTAAGDIYIGSPRGWVCVFSDDSSCPIVLGEIFEKLTSKPVTKGTQVTLTAK